MVLTESILVWCCDGVVLAVPRFSRLLRGVGRIARGPASVSALRTGVLVGHSRPPENDAGAGGETFPLLVWAMLTPRTDFLPLFHWVSRRAERRSGTVALCILKLGSSDRLVRCFLQSVRLEPVVLP